MCSGLSGAKSKAIPIVEVDVKCLECETSSKDGVIGLHFLASMEKSGVYEQPRLGSFISKTHWKGVDGKQYVKLLIDRSHVQC